MPSQLNGLLKTLTWNDFKTVTKTAPGPGESGTAASTRTTVNGGAWSLMPLANKRPAQYQLVDNLTVTISFDADNSWKASWVGTQPQAEQDRILKHEQGHFDLVALLGRDYFLGLMQLKAKVYSKQADFQLDMNALNAQFLQKIQPIQSKYDAETNHGMIQAKQDLWNGFINSAFTEPRVPPAAAADGIPLKRPILEVLSTANVSP